MLITGDSVALTLGYWLDPKQDTRGVQLRTEATLGCGLTAGTVHSDGNDLPTSEECSGWPLRWRKTVDEYQPSVAVMLVGAWDVVDHRIDGNILPVGTDAWVVYMTHQLDTATEVLSARRGPGRSADVTVLRAARQRTRTVFPSVPTRRAFAP